MKFPQKICQKKLAWISVNILVFNVCVSQQITRNILTFLKLINGENKWRLHYWNEVDQTAFEFFRKCNTLKISIHSPSLRSAFSASSFSFILSLFLFFLPIGSKNRLKTLTLSPFLQNTVSLFLLNFIHMCI